MLPLKTEGGMEVKKYIHIQSSLLENCNKE